MQMLLQGALCCVTKKYPMGLMQKVLQRLELQEFGIAPILFLDRQVSIKTDGVFKIRCHSVVVCQVWVQKPEVPCRLKQN